jgi:hypothetical protein
MSDTDLTTELHDAAWFAERIGMSEKWVRAHTHELPCFKYGGRVKFTEQSVEDFLDATRQRASAEIQISPRSRTARRRP